MNAHVSLESQLDELAKQDPLWQIFVDWRAKWYATARPQQIPPDGFTECGYMAGRGFGKLLDVQTLMPTPTGWTRLGDIRDGDKLFDETGAVITVVKAHEPCVPERMYRLTFSDGSTVDAGGEHLWTTLTHRARKQMLRNGVKHVPADWPFYRQELRDSWGNVTGHVGAETLTTDELAATFKHSSRGDLNHCIPTTLPLALPAASLPVDPWLLGYWLGNGSTNRGELTAGSYNGGMDGDHVTVMIGPDAKAVPIPEKGQTRISVKGLTASLRTLGVLDNKHVPAAYLRASEHQRLALLQGLCDSDGYAHPQYVEFCSADKALAEAVAELAISLGERPVLSEGRAKLNGKDYGPKYRVIWRGYRHNPFTLPRKRNILQPVGAQAFRQGHRMLVSCEPIEPVLSRCLTVDSPSRLYLAGRGMVPTHNTRVGAEWLAEAAILDPDAYPSAVIAPTYADVQKVCFEGPAGLLNVIPPELVLNYNSSDLIITLFTGAKIFGWTAEKPDRLRGPQHARLWCDEIAAWVNGKETLDMAMMGLRMGAHPQLLWTTTPRPTPLVRDLTKPKEGRVIVRGSTYDNRANLPKVFFDQLEQYEGTALGRQELDGELLDPEESGIIKRSWFRLWPANKRLPKLDFVLMSLDTAFTERTTDRKTNAADPSACTVWGSFTLKNGERHLLLLDCWQDHLGLPALVKKVKKEATFTYGDDEDAALIKPLFGSAKPATSGRKVDIILIEDKGSGISLRQTLVNEGIEAWAYNPGRADKLTRLHVVSHIFARRRIWLPESENHPGKPRTWVEPMLEQLCTFIGEGSTEHDDFVDSTTQAIRLAIDKGLVSAVKPDPTKAKDAPKTGSRNKTPGNPYAI